MAFVTTSTTFLRSRAPIHFIRTSSCDALSINRSRLGQCARMMATEKGVDPPPDFAVPTIFDKIISKEIPAKIVYEDDLSLAFHDVNPQAPIHVLVIPKKRLPMLSMAKESDKEILGHLMLTAAKVAELENLQDGYRILVNNGKNGLQSVYHLHLHVIGGRKLKWGPF